MSIEPGPPASNASQPPSTEALLYQYLQCFDAPCPVCGYNLRQLTCDICPECGRQFRLAIGATQPQFAAFLFFLMPPIMTGGLSLTILASMLADLVRHGGIRIVPIALWGLIALGFLDLAGVFVLYRRRSWFLRKPRPRRYLWVVASWLMHSAAVSLCAILT
jgi:hypothetical protein